MVRFGFSLLAAALLAFAGYGALGSATGASSAGPSLKVIATVVAHGHRHAAASVSHGLENGAVVQ